MALGLGLGLPYQRTAAAGGGGEPSERINNGDFAAGDVGWDTDGLSWTIAAQMATNNTPGPMLTTNLTTPTAGGESFTVSVDSVDNPAGTGWAVSLFNSSTLASQQILVAGFPNGTKTNSGTVSGVFDQLRIGASDDAGLVVDNVSFVA